MTFVASAGFCCYSRSVGSSWLSCVSSQPYGRILLRICFQISWFPLFRSVGNREAQRVDMAWPLHQTTSLGGFSTATRRWILVVGRQRFTVTFSRDPSTVIFSCNLVVLNSQTYQVYIAIWCLVRTEDRLLKCLGQRCQPFRYLKKRVNGYFVGQAVRHISLCFRDGP